MKRILCLILSAMFVLIPCSHYSEENVSEEKAKDAIEGYFEEAEHRILEVSFPVKIEGQNCYKIVVNGKLDKDKTYYIDTLAVSLSDDSRYFYSDETDQYERFYTDPTFSCKTSPDGRLRIESVGMNQDGPSGLHALREMRIIDLSTGEVLWSGESYLMNRFSWSEDSRFAAAEFSGRQWSETVVIDTEDFSVTELPGIDDIRAASPDAAAPNANVPMPLFRLSDWISPTVIRISFEWTTDKDTVVSGEYEYDVIDKAMDILKIDEGSRG